MLSPSLKGVKTKTLPASINDQFIVNLILVYSNFAVKAFIRKLDNFIHFSCNFATDVTN